MAAGKFHPFVVSYGSEELLLDRDLAKARGWTGRRLILLDGEEVTDIEIVNICETQSEEPRTIVVDNAGKVKGDKVLKEYIEAKQPDDTSLILVAIIRSEKLPAVWSLAISKGKGYERKKFKAWDTASYVRWIQNEAKQLKVSIDDSVAQILLQFVGLDLYRIANEVKKLAIYVGPLGKIQKEHVQLVTSFTPQADHFMVAEAVLNKDPRKALNTFSMLYTQSGDNSLIIVVHTLMKQVERTAIIRSLLDKGVAEDDIAALVGMKPWLFKNVAVPIARKHELKSLIRHMGRLCKTDADVKGPARSRTLVELTMLSIAQ